jgi:hypothetical protein
MKITEKLERAAGTFLTLNDRTDFDLGPVCKLLREAHDYILELEARVNRIPDAKKAGSYCSNYELGYADGWNECREEMLEEKENNNATPV